MGLQYKRIRKIIDNSFSQPFQAREYIKLKKSQWFSPKTLEIIQKKKLKRMIDYVYHNVEYYHNLFKSLNLTPDKIRTVDDLDKIPILTKTQIQNEIEKIVAHHIDKNRRFSNTTSGSTGKPLTLFYDRNAISDIKGRKLRNFFESGGHLRDKIVRFTNPKRFGKKTLLDNLGLLNSEYISVFDTANNQIKKLKQICPDVIECYPSILWLIGKVIQKEDIEGINPRIIHSTAELLSHKVRKEINSIFNVELFDQYGSMEFGTFAWECQEHNGYHMDIESLCVEFIKDGEKVSSEEKADIIVTGLFNFTMPLIRYKIGDSGSFSSELCHCGRGLPLMKILEGRTDDFLVLPSGTVISPRNINFLENVKGISEYRIIQKELDRILLQIVKGIDFSENTISQAKNVIRNGCLDEDIGINVEFVEKIPRDKSGKKRAVISELSKKTVY